MSIPALIDVYNETRRLSIAGSNLASGDFRLKKLIAPLEASAAKAPVFGKVAEALKKLIDSSAKDSAAALLELATLVSAVLYTQGETGAQGPLEPIETTDFGLPASNASARVLKPLIEALTTTGSGREEIIKDAHQRGAFQDLRLVRAAVAAVDDPYGPIADYIAEEVLPIYGQAIYDDLQTGYDPKAKGGHVRRLRLMHKLDPQRTHALVEQALEMGSPDMKVAAIECLEGRPEALSFLLEQSRAERRRPPRALAAMSTLSEDAAVEALIKALSGGDLGLAAASASRSKSPKVLAFLLEEGDRQLAGLFTIKDKAGKAIERFRTLLEAFSARDEKQTIAFLTRCFERRDEIRQLKVDADPQQINRQVASLLVRSNAAALKMLAGAHEGLPPEVLDWAMLAAVRTKNPKEVFDAFSPYYRIKADAKAQQDPAAEKREAVRELLSSLATERGHRRYFYRAREYARGDNAVNLDEVAKDAELDPRWLDAAIETDDLGMVETLARPRHKGACEFLSQTLEQKLKKKGDLDYDASNVLETMIRIEHPQAVEHFMSVLEKLSSGKRQYYIYWLARLIPGLPKSAAPRIEALLPSLHEKVADQIAPYLSELQAKT